MGNITLTVADDHALFRKGLVSIIQGFKNIELKNEASNGQELIEKMRKNPTDVVLMDLKMPEVDGIEAINYLRSQFPEVKVIVLTMHDEESLIIHMIELGANAYLLKNAEPDEVEQAIHQVAREGFYFNDHTLRVMHNGLVNKNKLRPNLDKKVELNERELKIISLICKEFTTAEIADKMFLSARTIEGYRKKLLNKVGAKNTAGLVIYAMKNELVA